MQYLTVRVSSPDKVFWEGKARSVSSVNSQGPFDILPQHANFMTIVEGRPIKIVDEESKRLEYKFEKAVIYTRHDLVSVYTQI